MNKFNEPNSLPEMSKSEHLSDWLAGLYSSLLDTNDTRQVVTDTEKIATNFKKLYQSNLAKETLKKILSLIQLLLSDAEALKSDREFLFSQLSTILDTFLNCIEIEQPDLESLIYAIHVFSNLCILMPNKADQLKVITKLIKPSDIENIAQQTPHPKKLIDMILPAFSADPDQPQMYGLSEQVEALLDHDPQNLTEEQKKFRSLVIYLLHFLYLHFPENKNKTIWIINQLFPNLGIESSEILSNWLFVDDYPFLDGPTIEIVNQLWLINPNYPRILYKQFGVARFGRYPLEILVSMVEKATQNMEGYEQQTTQQNYVIFCLSRSDWNGAFSTLQDFFSDAFSKLSKLN